MSVIIYDSCPSCGKEYHNNGSSIIIKKCSNCSELYCEYCNSNTFHRCDDGNSNPPLLSFGARTKSKKEKNKNKWW